MRRIAIYGKGGIGKSTIATHLAAAWGQLGLKVMLIGCDPKADSTRLLLGYRSPALLDHYEELENDSVTLDHPMALETLIEVGFAGVKCVEIGGPKPGVGCAGRGISLALELLDQLNAFDDLDCIIFDILGDVVCGGFATPMRLGFADEVYIITSGEYAALYAANNICRGIPNMGAKLGGLIANCRGLTDEELLIKEFAVYVENQMIGSIHRSSVFPTCELQKKTVMEALPDSVEAEAIRHLSKAVIQNEVRTVPTSMDEMDLEKLALSHLTS